MSVFLVDYENVNAGGLVGVDKLDENDFVTVFYSDKADTIKISVYERLNASRANVSFVSVGTGSKNSLDFQLVTYLGYLIAKDECGEYIIVSRDDGYKSTVSFWKQHDVNIVLALNLLKQSDNSLSASLDKLLPEEYRPDAPKILDFMKRYKTKQGFNNALLKEYGNDKTSRIYKSVKPMLSNMKGSN